MNPRANVVREGEIPITSCWQVSQQLACTLLQVCDARISPSAGLHRGNPIGGNPDEEH